MKNILVLTDFSNNAYNALFYVSRLFDQHVCHFFLMNVHDEGAPRSDWSEEADLPTEEEKKSKEGLEKVFHRINLDNPNPKHRFEGLSEEGDLLEVVKGTIERFHIELLVLGNKGTTGLGSVFWGSTASRVIASIKGCPVLAVPEDQEFDLPKEIAFATHYKKPFDAEVIAPLRLMANRCDASIRIVHINEEKRLNKFQESNLNTLMAYLKPIEHTVHWMPNFTSKTKAIQLFLDELNIGMLVMVNYEHSFLEYLLREPVIQRMTFHVATPFLIIPGD